MVLAFGRVQPASGAGRSFRTTATSTLGAFTSCRPPSLAIGRELPIGYIGAIQFFTSEEGVAVTPAMSCGPIKRSQTLATRFATTDDGGRRWVVQSVLPPAGHSIYLDTTPFPPLPTISFLNAHRGWVLRSGRLVATSDGGHRWRTVNLGGIVQALDLYDGHLSALAVRCQAERTNTCSAGTTWLKTYNPGTSHWATAAAAVPGGLTGGLVLGSHPGQAYVMPRPFAGGPIEGTVSAGNEWFAVNQPCQAMADEVYHSTGNFQLLAVAPSGALWVVCSGGPAAGSLDMALYVSEDGGKTWDGRAQPGGADVPLGLAFISDQQAIGVFGEVVTATTNAGDSWQETNVPSNGGGPMQLTALPPDNEWVLDPEETGYCGRASGLYHSTDGLHFAVVGPTIFRHEHDQTSCELSKPYIEAQTGR